MTTDKELLELAAKAAGYILPAKGDVDEIGRQYDPHLGLWVMWDYGQWNWFRPFLSDAHALRLAVKLRLSVCHEFDRIDVLFENDPLATEFVYEKPTPTDRYAATRRAIVKAAAEIGRAMT